MVVVVVFGQGKNSALHARTLTGFVEAFERNGPPFDRPVIVGSAARNVPRGGFWADSQGFSLFKGLRYISKICFLKGITSFFFLSSSLSLSLSWKVLRGKSFASVVSGMKSLKFFTRKVIIVFGFEFQKCEENLFRKRIQKVNLQASYRGNKSMTVGDK